MIRIAADDFLFSILLFLVVVCTYLSVGDGGDGGGVDKTQFCTHVYDIRWHLFLFCIANQVRLP